MSTTTVPSPIFNAQERVLCYHGPLIYEAKVLKTKSSDDTSSANGGPGPRYLVHYKGWKQTYVLSVPCMLFSPFPLLFCSPMSCYYAVDGATLFFPLHDYANPAFSATAGMNGSPRAACSSSQSPISLSRRPSSKPTPQAFMAVRLRQRPRARQQLGSVKRMSARELVLGRMGLEERNVGEKR